MTGCAAFLAIYGAILFVAAHAVEPGEDVRMYQTLLELTKIPPPGDGALVGHADTAFVASPSQFWMKPL
jgi:hypothetical protein